MYHRVAEKLVAFDTAASYSEAVDMIDANAIEIDGELVSISAGARINVQAQQGNDLENWTTLAGNTTIDIGYFSRAWTDIAARYVRFKISFTQGTGTAIVMLGVQTKAL